MAFEHRAVIEAQYQKLAIDRAQAVADYEAGRMAEDDYATMSAADRIVEADQKRLAVDRIASNFISQQQQQSQGSRYGLSADEVSIARGIAGNDPQMSDDERERLYAQNKERLRYMRATGQYRDDQGSVRR